VVGRGVRMSAGPNGALIDLRNVVKTYETVAGHVDVLKGITLKVAPGELVGIVGPSGSGKSTLLNMITGIDRPSDGEVLVGGEAVHTLSQNRLARWRGRNRCDFPVLSIAAYADYPGERDAPNGLLPGLRAT
jgi:predicted ABC-type transport system involved in lysophospholipase L1 biosynthesis ATPase subunit